MLARLPAKLMKTRDEQIEFMRINGVRVAACGWNGYEAKGRGMVCVLSELLNEVLCQVPFDFMPAADAARLFTSWSDSKEAKMVADYTPKTEIVICFLRKGNDNQSEIDAYRIQTRPAPPAAAEREG